MNEKLNKKAIDIFKEDFGVYLAATVMTLAVSFLIPSEGAGVIKYAGYFISYSVQFGVIALIYMSLAEGKTDFKNIFLPFTGGRAVKAMTIVAVFVAVNAVVDMIALVLKDLPEIGSAMGTVIGIIRILFLPVMCLFLADSSRKTGEYLKVSSELMMENFGKYLSVAFKYVGPLILVIVFATMIDGALYVIYPFVYILIQIDLTKFILGIIPRDFQKI